jgi:hypothetical protein
MEIGAAVLHASTELWCNPEQAAVNSLLIRENPSSSQLRITKSKTLVVDSHDSMGPPPPKRPRGKPAKVSTQIVPEEVVSLDSDDDEEKSEGSNKENVPDMPMELPETQVSEVGELPETQISEEMPEMPMELPETQDSFVTAADGGDAREEVNNNTRTTRSSTKSPEKAPAPSTSSRIDTTNKALTNVSFASAPMSKSDLFNFTSSSSAGESSRNTRKRKNSVEAPISENLPASKKPTPAKKSRIIDDDSDEEVPVPPKNPKRKRAAEPDLGGLFAFNTSFIKRMKPAEPSQSPTKPSGIIALTPKPAEEVSVARRVRHISEDSCDSGVWLSKAMTSVKLDDSIVKPEPDSSLNTQDIKLESYPTLFSVVETTKSTNMSTTSTTVPKRKQFVKKQNFKPQSSIVTMKVYKVEDTMVSLDRF